MITKPPLAVFRPLEIQVPFSRPRSTKGQPFEFRLGSKIIQELGSSREGSKNPTTQTSTPRFVEEVVTEVMQANKAIELFQTMAIVNMNMGNLNMEENSLKNRLTIEEKEMAIL